MNKLFGILALLILVSCGRTQEYELIRGQAGSNGSNGHSLVSQILSASELLCPNGGSSLDVYLDLDDSLSVSESDVYQNSLIACNGQNGENGIDGEDGEDGKDGRRGRRGPRGLQGVAGPVGPVGPQGVVGPIGPVGDTGLTGQSGQDGEDGSDGTSVIITSYSATSCSNISETGYYVKKNGSNIAIYDEAGCHGSDKVEEINNDDSFWFSSTKLGVAISTGGIRVISFN